jgi:four helix bundle protein
MGRTRSNTHKDLIVWQKAFGLAVAVHQVSARFPRHELFGLTSQLRRAAISVPSNIAEGAARRTTRDFLCFLHIARGSLAELETQLLLGREVGYLDDVAGNKLLQDLAEVGRLINAFIVGLRRRAAGTASY